MGRGLRILVAGIATILFAGVMAPTAFAKGELAEIVVSGGGLAKPIHIPFELISDVWDGSEWQSVRTRSSRTPPTFTGPAYRIEWWYENGADPYVQTFHPAQSGMTTGRGPGWQPLPTRFTERLETLIAHPEQIPSHTWSDLKPILLLIGVMSLFALASLLPRRLESMAT